MGVTISYENGAQQVILNGENVSGLIRTEAVSQMASASSVYLPVREKLVELQKELARNENVIMDGRDIGSVVFPNADVKFFMTASPQVRAMRRYKELTAKGEAVDYAEVEENVRKRDYIDEHREESPLKRTEDAVLIDNSNMTIEEEVQVMMAVIEKKKC